MTNTSVLSLPELELPKVVRKKMDPFPNAEDDYAILDELLKVGVETQKLSVSPVTLEVKKTDTVVDFQMPPESYILPDQAEDRPLGEILRAKRTRASATSSSGVTVTGKHVGDDVPLGGVRGKRPRNVNVEGKKDGPVTFEGLAPPSVEIPKGKLSRVLEEGEMVDEGFLRRMVADLKDAGVDKLLAQGATPRENRAKMLQHLMRVCNFLSLAASSSLQCVT